MPSPYNPERKQGKRKRKTENGKLTDPLRSFAPRPPNLEGQRKRKTKNGKLNRPTAHRWCVFVYFTHFSAHFLPLYASNDVTLHPISLKN